MRRKTIFSHLHKCMFLIIILLYFKEISFEIIVWDHIYNLSQLATLGNKLRQILNTLRIAWKIWPQDYKHIPDQLWVEIDKIKMSEFLGELLWVRYKPKTSFIFPLLDGGEKCSYCCVSYKEKFYKPFPQTYNAREHNIYSTGLSWSV